MIEKVKTQKGVKIEHAVVEGANHFFDGKVDELMESVDHYLTKRLGEGRGGGLSQAFRAPHPLVILAERSQRRGDPALSDEVSRGRARALRRRRRGVKPSGEADKRAAPTRTQDRRETR